MKLISQIDITRPSGKSAIQLLQGDLSAIPSEHETDILAMSAFPNDYAALKGSLVYALDQKGLSVEALASDKETDLRSQLNCWLSKPLSKNDQAKFNFKRILCFEPGEKIREPDEIVGNIFRCINTFVFDDGNNIVAMPIIGTGYQHVPLDAMLPTLLAAAVFWLQNGLPVDCIKLVVYDADQANEANVFFRIKGNEVNSITSNNTSDSLFSPGTIKGGKINLFISYSTADQQYFDELKQYLNSNNLPGVNIWDHNVMKPGSPWDEEIKEKLAASQIILLMITPDFLNSYYLNEVELKAALQRHELKECRVIPIFTKRCAIDNYEQITRLQGIPANRKFLSELGEQAFSQYDKIQRTVMEVAMEMKAENNIGSSILSNDTKSVDVKKIETSNGKQKIFLSIHNTEKGRKKRKALIIQVEGKIKYENWPYKIVPSLEEEEELLKKSEEEFISACYEYVKEAAYSIHIMEKQDDFENGLGKIQYEAAGTVKKEQQLHNRIAWLTTSALKSKVRKEILIEPVFIGNDFEYLFDWINGVAGELEKPSGQSTPQTNYDYFLSYAHKHAEEIKYFVDQLKSANKGLLLFYDKDNIPPGGLWIQQISNAIANAEKVIIFLSPDYDNSPVCWDEFQCAKLMEYNKKKSIIQTVYLYGHANSAMPPMMGIYSYIDCREGNKQKIDECIKQLLK